MLSTESSVLSRNFPVIVQNNRELKNDLAKTDKNKVVYIKILKNKKIITGNSNF
mgnify:CR=1 FL=1